MKIDDIDRLILQHLQVDARVSMRELAKKVNLSAPSVTERVKRLESAGIIEEYTIKLNKKKLGLPVACIVELTIKNGQYPRFQQFIAEYPYAEFCYRIAGQACYVLKLQLPDLSMLESFINDVMPLATTVSHVVLSEVKIKNILPSEQS
ncbi:Lrp/AsnC family transcriptional regulator [Priestia koreensis]|uniref:Lrp/AsnC family transcriptional regulator n=1 Tax=Priestia koreensis TaxID=284581 RepID=UPI001F58F9F1|nr:Lrp/AsnC family transcriptional regulator [Priestia koreensis]MCM3004273.1 Lrp/AsnC family transcriptional regulator [Priestia koreensis]UNL83485.1 Lrp/AsnC family transcriptional regulator [Priestia koreensis]